MAYIYKTTNMLNGKIYIGQSKRPKNDSYLGSGKNIKKEISLHGICNFKKEILEDNIDISILDQREIHWISIYNSTNQEIGYNITNGGSGYNAFGIKRTDEFKEKVSISKKGKPPTECQLKALKELHKKMKGKEPWNKGLKTGILLSEDHKEKLRSSRKGIPSWNAGIKGCYTRDEVTKKKISDANKGKPKSENHRQKISDANKGKSSISLYEKWTNKYGKDIADEKMKAYKEKQSLTKRNANKK